MHLLIILSTNKGNNQTNTVTLNEKEPPTDRNGRMMLKDTHRESRRFVLLLYFVMIVTQ